MIRQSVHELRFGDLWLSTGDRFTEGESFWFSVHADGATLGNPVAVFSTLAALLHDGSLVRTERYDNREPGFRVTIHAADGDALAEAEAALFLECGRPNVLSWTPPDGFGATTVMDVLTSSLEFVLDDFDELRVERTYQLTLVALPFGRSDAEVVVPAVTSDPSPVTVTVSDGTSTSGWSVEHGTASTPTVVSGALEFAANMTPNSTGSVWSSAAELVFAGSVDMSTTPYVSLDVTFHGASASGASGLNFYPALYADGVALRRVGNVGTRVTWACPDASVAEFRLTPGVTIFNNSAPLSSASATIRVDNLIRTNQAPSTGSTKREKSQVLPILGSARSPGAMAVEHPTSSLGEVLVYTYPADGLGYVPSLYPYRSGSWTADAALVSGAYSATSSAFSVPLRTLRPGPYLAVVRVKGQATSTSETITVTVDGQATSRSGLSSLSDSAWTIVRVGVLTIPDHEASTSFNAAVSIAHSGLDLDEAWLFYVGDDAHLTHVNLGTGTPTIGGDSNRLWIDTPTTDRPYPTIWRGTLADRSDARTAVTGLIELGSHRFAPPEMMVFTVTTNALDAATSFRHHPRWHSNARHLPVGS